MKKVIFDSKQETVQLWPAGDAVTVQIFQNEREITAPNVNEETGELTGEMVTSYEYDFNEWTADDVDTDAINAITADPAAYLNYTPAVEPTLSEKVDQNTADIEYLTMMMEG